MGQTFKETDPHWGVDSVTPATWKPSPNKTLYDEVKARKKPSYWDRYIRTPDAPGPAYNGQVKVWQYSGDN